MSITSEQPREGVIRLAEEDAVAGSREWVARSACAPYYARTAKDHWFGPAETEEDNRGRVIPAEDRQVAKSYCLMCPVKQECLEYAMRNGIKYGIWGGKAPEERTRLARLREARRDAS